jgi:tetratricopeptide (TPR) repeat protein
VAQKSLDYLDSLAQDEDRDVGVLGELASAYLNVGSLQAWTLQDNASALRSYQKAVAIQRQRILLAPNDATMKTDLASGLFKLSEALEGFGRHEEILQACDEIIQLHETLLATDPANEALLLGISANYERRGELLRGFKRSEEAKADFHSALASIKREINLAKETARDPQARLNLSFAYLQQGLAFNNLGEWQNAAESYEIAGQIAEDVYRENPGLTQALRSLGSSHGRRGDALDKLGDYRGALENYRYALKIFTEARARNPNSNELRYSEAKYTVNVGIALRKSGQLSDSLALVRRGLGLSREYIAEDRSRSATIIYGAELFEQSADFLAGAGRHEEAIAVYQEALQILERLAAETTQDSGVRILVAKYDAAVGDLYASFDSETKTIKATSQAALLKARNRYQQSLDTLKSLQQRGVFLSELANNLEEVSQKLSACDAALAKLKS